ncbi:MAG: hypothetical protein NTZ63_05575 [Candidatus Omnitrophica bacterium]|nr:hypothetical protein [Candidatus Omnitrophota bacterium]
MERKNRVLLLGLTVIILSSLISYTVYAEEEAVLTSAPASESFTTNPSQNSTPVYTQAAQSAPSTLNMDYLSQNLTPAYMQPSYNSYINNPTLGPINSQTYSNIIQQGNTSLNDYANYPSINQLTEQGYNNTAQQNDALPYFVNAASINAPTLPLTSTYMPANNITNNYTLPRTEFTEQPDGSFLTSTVEVPLSYSNQIGNSFDDNAPALASVTNNFAVATNISDTLGKKLDLGIDANYYSPAWQTPNNPDMPRWELDTNNKEPGFSDYKTGPYGREIRFYGEGISVFPKENNFSSTFNDFSNEISSLNNSAEVYSSKVNSMPNQIIADDTREPLIANADQMHPNRQDYTPDNSYRDVRRPFEEMDPTVRAIMLMQLPPIAKDEYSVTPNPSPALIRKDTATLGESGRLPEISDIKYTGGETRNNNPIIPSILGSDKDIEYTIQPPSPEPARSYEYKLEIQTPTLVILPFETTIQKTPSNNNEPRLVPNAAGVPPLREIEAPPSPIIQNEPGLAKVNPSDSIIAPGSNNMLQNEVYLNPVGASIKPVGSWTPINYSPLRDKKYPD